MGAGQHIRVFVSSTFRDFDAERDALRRVERSLDERLAPHGARATLVDLRWGVFAGDAEGDREVEVLRVCLDEVRRTRPYFLGLLGSRYGWVPDERLATAAASRAGMADDVAGRSVTEMEISLGVLDAPPTSRRATFLLRELRDAAPPEFADPPGSDAARRQRLLRRRIEEVGLPLRRYDATVHDGRLDLGRFEEIAHDALWELIEPDLDPTPIDDAHVHLAFAAARADDVRGRDETIDELARALRHDAGTLTVVAGGPGTGKSAVLAAAERAARDAGATTVFHSYGVGDPGGTRRIVERIERAVTDDSGAPDAEPDAPLAALVERVLTLGADSGRRVALCIDALDESESLLSSRLAWLPDPPPPWLSVVATTRWWEPHWKERATVRELAPLAPEAGREVLLDRFTARSKDVPDEVVDALTAIDGTDGPACTSPLWSRIAAEMLCALDLFDFVDLASFEGDAEQRLRHLLAATARSLPAEVEDLYGLLLERAGRTMSVSHLDAIVDAVALSQVGVEPQVLREVASGIVGEPLTDLDVAKARWAMAGQLVEQGRYGEIDVQHAQLREVVRQRCGEDRTALVHHRLGAAFAAGAGDDQRLRRAAGWHLVRAGAHEDLARAIVGAERRGGGLRPKVAARAALGEGVGEALGREGPAAIELLEALAARGTDQTEVAAFVVGTLALDDARSEEERFTLLDRSIDLLLETASPDGSWSNEVAAFGVQVSWYWAHFRRYREAGDDTSAMEALEDALVLIESTVALEPDEVFHRAAMASVLGAMSDLAAARGDHSTALDRALRLAELIDEVAEAGVAMPPAILRPGSEAHIRVSELAAAVGDEAVAARHLDRAMAVARANVARDPYQATVLFDLAAVCRYTAGVSGPPREVTLVREAQDILVRLVALYPDDPRSWWNLSANTAHLANRHWEDGDREAARARLADAVETAMRAVVEHPSREEVVRNLFRTTSARAWTERVMAGEAPAPSPSDGLIMLHDAEWDPTLLAALRAFDDDLASLALGPRPADDRWLTGLADGLDAYTDRLAGEDALWSPKGRTAAWVHRAVLERLAARGTLGGSQEQTMGSLVAFLAGLDAELDAEDASLR